MMSQRTRGSGRIEVESRYRRLPRPNGYPELRQKPASSPRVSECHRGGAPAAAPWSARRLVRETDQRVPTHLEGGRRSLRQGGKSLRGSIADRNGADHGSNQKTSTAGK